MVSSDIEQHNGVKFGHTLQLELQDMLNSHDMNPVLGSKGDELKVGSKQQEQLHLSPKLNFLNALKGSDVDENKGRMSLDMNPVRNLHFAPPAITDGRVTVAPPLDVFEDGCELWKSTLVGHFVGQKLPYPVVNSIAKRIWGSHGLSEVLSSDNGFFLFTFDSVDRATNVLERAPWHMANRPLVLKRWHPNMQFLKDDLDRVPVWVKLYNVPLEYWTVKGLSCVASAIGVPLHADLTTLLRKRLSYARVCVEIEASKTLVKEYDLRCPNGLFITISADYEWIPSRCNNCNVFGHTTAICATSKVDDRTMGAEGKRKIGAVNSKHADNKQNQLQWQVVGKRNKGVTIGENDCLASKELNCNENGCLASALHSADCNTNESATLDVPNAGCYEDENPTSPLILKSLRADMVPEEGDACTSLDQSSTICNATMNPVSHEVNVDIGVMGGGTGKEDDDKESTSLIPTSPQSPISSDGETFINQLASKARDSLEKKKTGSPGFSKKSKKSGSSRGGKSR